MDEHVGTEHSGYVNYECTSATNGSIVLTGIVNTDLTVSVLQDLNDIAFALRLIVLHHVTELGLVQGSNVIAVVGKYIHITLFINASMAESLKGLDC